MDKLIIGAIIVLLLLALIPIKSELLTFTDSDPVPALVTDDSKESQALLIRLDESNPLDQLENSELAQDEIEETGSEGTEIEPEMAGNDRGIFISIGSILLFGILLLLPLHLQKL